MSTSVGTTATRATRAGVYATYAAFIATGFAFASWASRIPQVRDRLQLSSGDLGLVLLGIAAGSVISLPLAGPLVARIGSRRTVQGMAVLDGLALAGMAVGFQFGVAPLVVGLFFFGFAQGAWDVAMNVQGAIVERRVGKAIMPRFHAGFSVGTVAGALSGAGMVALKIPVTAHLLVVAVLVICLVPLAVRGFVPDSEPVEVDSDAAAQPEPKPRRALDAWLEPRTLVVGLFVLAFAFAEGTGNDWSAVALIDGYDTAGVTGTLGFATFLAAMTLGRWFGPGLLDRYGRVPVVRVMAVISLVGVLLFVFGTLTPLAFVGALLWGFGLSLGFPVGMSAGADEPEHAASRVSVIASVGYVAFLGGPPLIGFLGEQVGVLHALTAVAVLLAIAIMIAGSIRPIGPAQTQLPLTEPALSKPAQAGPARDDLR